MLSMLGLLLHQIAIAQEEGKVVILTSFEEVIERVELGNFDLKKYRYDLDKTALELKIAKAHRLPTLSGTFNGQRNLDLATTPLPGEIFGQPGTTINAEFGQEYTYNAGLTLTKSILDWQAIFQVKLSALNLESAEIQKKSFEELLYQQAGVYYFSALVARQAIELWEEDIQLADSIELLTKQRYEEGVLDKLSYNKARINALVVRQNLNNSLQLYNQSIAELKKLTGIQPDQELLLEQRLTYELPTTYSIDLLLPSKQIAIADMQIQQAKMRTNLQKANFLPKLTFTSYFGRQQFQDGFGLDFGNDSWSNFSYLALNVSVPIFSGFANRNRLKSSKLDYELAKEDWENQQLVSALEDAQLITDYNHSLENTKLAQNNLELYHQNKELTFQQYKEGVVSLDTYLSTFEDYLKAENAFLNNLLTTYQYYSQIYPRMQ